MHIAALAVILLALCAPLTGCKRSLDEGDVREFIDMADNATRKRFAPEICELRGKDFKLHVTFQGHDAPFAPTELEMDRKLFCKQAGTLSRLRQYRLERNATGIAVSPDRKTARVIADYVETMPYYEPNTLPSTPDDFREFQVVVTHDESVVGIEGGDLVFLSTRSDSNQLLVDKNKIDLAD
jgi:hypothetical protein